MVVTTYSLLKGLRKWLFRSYDYSKMEKIFKLLAM